MGARTHHCHPLRLLRTDGRFTKPLSRSCVVILSKSRRWVRAPILRYSAADVIHLHGYSAPTVLS